MECICRINSPLGPLTAAGNHEGLLGLWMENQKYFLATLPANTPHGELPVFDELRRWLNIYFSGGEPGFTPTLAPRGSEFRQAVWKLLLAIPYGQLTTYGSLAEELSRQTGRGASARAVGGAVGHNPISIIVPCHRVVGAGGSLTGYAGGLERKLTLLRLEGVDTARLTVPAKGTAL